MNDSWLLDASWILFAALSLIVAAVSLAAFGPDLLALLSRNFPNISNKTRPYLHR